MAVIDDLISQISDESLRQRIAEEVKGLKKQKKFGLVFEEHVPECTPLYEMPIKVGKKVALKEKSIKDIYTVLSMEEDNVKCFDKVNKEEKIFKLEDLVCVAEFGEPIYPYLKPIDSICNAPDSNLWHTLIEADNYHALQLLEYLYAGKVDCIYIDPPYNTGAKDWKYNNDYVDAVDEYRHSKWLSFMEKRLKIAKNLLNPKNSVLIITIDDKEYLHLGCILEDLFKECKMTMISSVINPVGKAKKGGIDFSRTDEYIYFIQIGEAQILPEIRESSPDEIRWQSFRRSSLANGRGMHGVGACGPNQFYPIYVNDETKKIVEFGEPIPEGVDRFSVKQIPGCSTVFPVRDDGIEINWGATRETAMSLYSKGYFKVGISQPNKPQQYSIKYLTKGVIKDIENQKVIVTGYDEDGSILGYYPNGKMLVPTTNWNKPTHNATSNGTDLLTNIFVKARFDYPKSLYAVVDSLKIIVGNNPNALIVDFFAGSGTTLHAVNLLNEIDNGHRKCILVTNNEVGEKETKILKESGFKPGDAEWEKIGIANYVTWPRTKCSILGENINGQKLKNEYITGINNKIEKNISIKRLQIDISNDNNGKILKKQILSMMSEYKFCLSKNDEENIFLFSEDKYCAILFDINYAEDFIEQIENSTGLIYIITTNNKAFKEISNKIKNNCKFYKEEEYKIPMSNGFKTNANFFKLSFLDKNNVRLGRNFKELLPVLWMKSGSVGECPIIDDDNIDMLILPKNKMAVLLNEDSYAKFISRINKEDIRTIFFVTDFEPNFISMASNFKECDCYQLYRDYLDNFRINVRRN